MKLAASLEIPYFQFLDPDGQLSADAPADLADPSFLLSYFRKMVACRAFDTKAIALQRTGKLGTYASSLGHEATHVGMGAFLQDEDCFAPSYREHGTLFERGVQAREILLYWGGDERGSDFAHAPHDFPMCVPISTQMLHAAGVALSYKLRGMPQVAMSSCGDGGSSKTDFYAAVNSAGAYKLPLVLCIVNNGWAISVPRSAQTGAGTLAQKGLAGGLYSAQVDGNDLIAVLYACREAIDRARRGEGATLLEFMTYRLHDHTTADDARRYRAAEEVEAAWKVEPFIRLRKYLTANGLWSDEQEQELIAQTNEWVAAEIDAYLQTPMPPVSAMFDYLYGDMPSEVLEQRELAMQRERQA